MFFDESINIFTQDLNEELNTILKSELTAVFTKGDDVWQVIYSDKDNELNIWITDTTNELDSSSITVIDRPTLKVAGIYIKEEQQGKGRQIVAALINLLKNTKIKRIIAVAKNEGAQQFWTKVGFTKVHKAHPTFSMDI